MSRRAVGSEFVKPVSSSPAFFPPRLELVLHEYFPPTVGTGMCVWSGFQFCVPWVSCLPSLGVGHPAARMKGLTSCL